MAQEFSEDRIRERAHQIWEREGGRDGDHESHWERAQAELQQEAGADGGSDTSGLSTSLQPGSTTPGGGPAPDADSMGATGKGGKGVKGPN